MQDTMNDTTSDPGTRQCDQCGQSFAPKSAEFTSCFNCHKKGKESSAPIHHAPPSEELAAFNNYLSSIASQGYFAGDQIRDSLIIADAQTAARILVSDATRGQLGQFYEAVRVLERRALRGSQWSMVRAELLAFAPLVHKIVARDTANRRRLEESLLPFIITHTDQMQKASGCHEFVDGFARHFHSVWSYFTFYGPSNKVGKYL